MKPLSTHLNDIARGLYAVANEIEKEANGWYKNTEKARKIKEYADNLYSAGMGYDEGIATVQGRLVELRKRVKPANIDCGVCGTSVEADAPVCDYCEENGLLD